MMAAIPAVSAADKTDTRHGPQHVTENVTFNAHISPLTISVNHPVNVGYAISPDAETFTAPDIKCDQPTPKSR